jgi:hypothetical protein
MGDREVAPTYISGSQAFVGVIFTVALNLHESFTKSIFIKNN